MKDKAFNNPLYRQIKNWLTENEILAKPITAIHSEFNKFIDKQITPEQRQLLIDDNVITTGGHLTNEGMKILIRLNTWDFRE